MAYLLLDAHDVVIHISDTIDYQSNGNPLVDNGTLAYAAVLVNQVIEADLVPEYVTAHRYCYVDGHFVENPDWSEPVEEEYLTPHEVISILTGEGT